MERSCSRYKDAIEHLSKTIPKKDHNHLKVLTAATILTRAAEGRDFVMHAHIATNPGAEPQRRASFRILKEGSPLG